MKAIFTLATAASLVVGGAALVGCGSNDNSQPQGHDANFSGGNGAFGTSPEKAGRYENQNRDVAPTTQPGNQ